MTILRATAVAVFALGMALTPPAFSQSVLRISAGASDISRLDPHRTSATGDKAIISLVFSGLVRFKPGSADPKDIEPDLAERWGTSPDGLVWTFALRSGVKFHGDWGEFDSSDALYSLRRAADPARSTFAANFGGIASVEAPDARTLRVTLKYPDASFLGLVTSYHGGNVVSRRAAEQLGDGFGANPVGTGPFRFVEHVTQRHVRLAAHDGYFRGRPKIDQIMYLMIASDSSRELAFTSGELDVFNGRREQRWVDGQRRRPGTIVDIFRPGEFRTLHINKTIAPLNDVRVRQALAHAINVDEIVRFVGADVGPRGCSVVPPGYLGEDCGAGPIAFDPARSRALLAAAGHPNGFTIRAVVSNISAQQPIMEVIQAQLGRVGIKLEMDIVDHPTYHAQIRRNVSALVFYGAARFPVANDYLTEFYHSAAIVGKPTAITNFSHCAVADADIEAARRESDPAKQIGFWREAQRKIAAEVCAVPLFDLLQVWGRGPHVDLGYELKGAMNLAPPITELTSLRPR
jgi:peptide/nickel transport system substrate-binding protein